MEHTYRIPDFRGLARDAAPGGLDPREQWISSGSDLFERGTWRVRRGQVRLRTLPLDGAVLLLYTFETRPGEPALVAITSAGTFYGWPYLAFSGDPIDPVDLVGEGVDGAGEGGYGV